MQIEPMEDRIRDIDAQIVKVAQEFAEHVTGDRSLKSLDERVRFLRVLFRRRECILEDYARRGGNVENVYTEEIVIGGD